MGGPGHLSTGDVAGMTTEVMRGRESLDESGGGGENGVAPAAAPAEVDAGSTAGTMRALSVLEPPGGAQAVPAIPAALAEAEALFVARHRNPLEAVMEGLEIGLALGLCR